MSKYYYLATNILGYNRALESGNGWSVTAYKDKETRDKIYDSLSYERTGCMIPSEQDINDIMGTDNWGVCEYIRDDDGGFDVGPCD